MPRILATHLDKVRDSFDKTVKELVAQMRKRADKVLTGVEKEAAIKYMPESFEHWVHTHPDFTRKDFEESQWGELATIAWDVSTNKALAMHRAYQNLRIGEKEMPKGWTHSA